MTSLLEETGSKVRVIKKGRVFASLYKDTNLYASQILRTLISQKKKSEKNEMKDTLSACVEN